MSQIKFRFESQKDLKFMSLMDSNNFGTFFNSFPQYLKAELGDLFDHTFILFISKMK